MNGAVVEGAVSSSRHGDVATITIGDGTRLNALGTADWRALERTALAVAGDLAVGSVVVEGRGGAFCSGSDLREWDASTPAEVDAGFEQMERALAAVEAIPVPTVARIERVAAGAGCQLALACDLQVIEATARIGMPVTRLGILIPTSFATRLALRVGPSRAKAMLFDGALFPAGEARAMGLVTDVVEPGDASRRLTELQSAWSGMSPHALRHAKRAVDLAVGATATETTAREAGGTGQADRPNRSTAADFAGRVQGFLSSRRRSA